MISLATLFVIYLGGQRLKVEEEQIGGSGSKIGVAAPKIVSSNFEQIQTAEKGALNKFKCRITLKNIGENGYCALSAKFFEGKKLIFTKNWALLARKNETKTEEFIVELKNEKPISMQTFAKPISKSRYEKYY